jgi:hypothetical protein
MPMILDPDRDMKKAILGIFCKSILKNASGAFL